MVVRREGGSPGCQREGGAILVVREKGRLSWLSERRRGDSLSCQRGEGGYLCWLPHKAGTQLLETFLWDLPWGKDDSQHLPSLPHCLLRL